MQLVKGDPAAVAAWISAAVTAAQKNGERTGVLAFAEHAARYDADCVLVVGSLARLDTAAQGLYAALREFDAQGVQRIWSEACPEHGIGHALMNRFARARRPRSSTLSEGSKPRPVIFPILSAYAWMR